MKLAIDPGHGNANKAAGQYDPGACAGGVAEADTLSPIWRGIREVGFPAAAFVLLYVYQWRVLAELVRAIREVRDEMASCRSWREGGHRR